MLDVKALNYIRTEKRAGVPSRAAWLGCLVATGSSAKSRNLIGIVDFRFLTITGLDPVASTTLGGLPAWGPRSAPRF